MKSVRLTLRHDVENVHPMHRFVADHDEFDRYHLIHWNHAHDGQNVFVFHVVGDHETYREALEDVDEILISDITPVDDSSFYVYVREEPNEIGQQLVDAFSRRSLVPVPPLEFRFDWSVRFTLVGEPEDIRGALEATPDDVGTTVERIGEYDGKHPGMELTDRQREVVRVARDLGYFAVPREATVEDIAERIGCAPGTAAEHLRKAESAVMESLEI